MNPLFSFSPFPYHNEDFDEDEEGIHPEEIPDYTNAMTVTCNDQNVQLLFGLSAPLVDGTVIVSNLIMSIPTAEKLYEQLRSVLEQFDKDL